MKSLRKTLHYLLSPFTFGLIVTIAFVVISIAYYTSRENQSAHGMASGTLSGLIQQIHEKTIDWRLINRGQLPASDRVAILAIDEKSITQEGRWPWPREKVAKLIEKTLALGAKEIAFDMVFSERDQNSAKPTLHNLKRELVDLKALTPATRDLLDNEINKVSGDQKLANVIHANADHLIMGNYFDTDQEEFVRKPYMDICFDARFERTYESSFWKNEAIPMTVFDDTAQKSAALKEHLAQYFTALDVQRAGDWFRDNPDIIPKIKNAFDEAESSYDPDSYPGLASLWLRNDIETAKLFMSALAPDRDPAEATRSLFYKLDLAFSPQKLASLSEYINKASSSYCAHFLTDADDLTSYKNFVKLWGDKPESKEQFEALSLASVWPQIQAEVRSSRSIASSATESFESYAQQLRTSIPQNVINKADRFWVDIPLIGDATKHSGYFNAHLDSDGSIRRAMFIARLGNTYVPSLPFKAFLVDKKLKPAIVMQTEKGSDGSSRNILTTFELQNEKGEHVLNLPTDHSGNLMINYSGGRNMFPYVSASDILDDGPNVSITTQEKNAAGHWIQKTKSISKSQFFKDKIFVAGATAVGVFDLRVTPFEENFPGVETHANVISNLLTEYDLAQNATADRKPASTPGFLRESSKEPRFMWITLLITGLVLSALLTYFGSVAGLGITGVALGGVYVIDRYWFFNSGIVTTVIFPFFEIISTFVTLTFYKYFTEEKKKRELKDTFQKYVSPAIVNEVLADPENIELGGKKMELTVLFSDVRGFTTISEKLDPRQLSNLLNSYLTPMTNLVFKNKGTLDKYMGDAVMAFWGAPIHFPDHATHAARCALQMIEQLKVLQKEYRAKGLPEIDIGIGLNTGDMSVGNMGSDTVRSYTVMGDAVNLGSRLEGINKQYGTRIIISEFTEKQLSEKFIRREIDRVRVKGKAQPVRIFELIAEGKITKEQTEALHNFGDAMVLYDARKFAEAIEVFKRVLDFDPNDEVSQLYCERCDNYIAEPPPENWDGVFTMTSK